MQKESEVQKVQWDLLVCLALLALLDLLVILELLVLMANLVHLVLLVALVIKDHLDPQVHKVPLDQLAFLDPQALLVPLVLLENVVTVVKLDHKVLKDLLDLEASLVLLVNRERRVRPELLVLKVPKDIEVLLVSRVFLVLRVPLEIKVCLVLLVHLVQLVSLVRKVPLVVMEELVYKVLWVPLVLVVLQVMKVVMVLLVLLVLLVPLVHLVNLWDMMLQLWQLYLVKAKVKAQIPSREMIQNCLHVCLEKKLLMMSARILSLRHMSNLRLHSRSSSNQREQKTLQQRLAKILHMLIQSFLVASTGLIRMKVTLRMLSWFTVTWKRRPLVYCHNLQSQMNITMSVKQKESSGLVMT